MRKKELDVSRRNFLKWSAAAAVLSGGLTACGSSGGEDTIVAGGGSPQDKPDALLKAGKWVTVPCPDCATYRCVNRAYVVDGIPVRQKTDDSHPYSYDYPQFRPCIKGRSMRWSVLSPARLKYPMKRVSWKPGGSDFHPELRGRDEWVRITWAEALQHIVSECNRINSEYMALGSGTSHPYYDANYAASYGINNAIPSPILNLAYTADMEPRFLNALGIGTLPIFGQNSTGAWPCASTHMVGDRIEATKSDRITVAENSNLIVQWGVNPSWTKFGSQQTYRAAKERGCKVYNVGPWLAPGSAAFVDEWIPCRPGTDTALLLAIAYVAISEGLIDEDWVNAHCVGYDHLHMPLRDSNNFPILDGNGVSVIEPSGSWGPGNALTGEHHRYWQENFKDYVLGTYDGVPKTPAWASAICGAPVNKIISLAKDMALIKPMAVISGDAPARVYHGGSYAQAFFAIGMLCGKGNIGVPGGRLDDPGLLHFGSYQYFSRNDRFISGWYLGLLHEQLGDTLRSPAFPVAPAAPVTTPATTAGDRPRNPKGFISYGAIRQPWATLYGNYQANEYYGIGFAEVWDAILTGEHHDPGHTRYNMDDTELLPGHGKKKVDIRAILKIDITNCVNQVVNTNKAVQAMRSPKVEFIAATDFYMTSTLRYADIILPCISFWEHEGHYSFLNPEIMIGNPERVIAPMFECRADTDVDAELCKIAGVDPKFAAPYTEKQAMFNALANAYVFKTDGTTKEPLVKFTANDIYDLGVDADTSPTSSLLTEGRITYQEFKEKGLYQVRMTEKTKQNEGWLKDLVENGTPLTANYTTRFTGTETGKVELYCMKLKRYHDLVYSFGTTHLDPLPKYQADTAHGYEATQALNAEYPLQCYSVHPYHRIHSQRSDNSSVVELCDDIATINVLDAQRYGISNGDWVLIESEAGKILRRASVVSTIMPGVMQTTEGATARYNYGTSGFEDESIDIGGNANTLTYSLLCGEGHQAYNSVVVKISRWTGTPPLPQYKWEPDVPRMASE